MAIAPADAVVIAKDGNTSSTAESNPELMKIEPTPSESFPEKTANDEASLAVWKPSTREWLIILCLCMISMVVALDSNIIGPALPAISRGLNGNATYAFWTGTSYLLTCAVFQPFIISLSDIFGRRQLLFSSVALFTIGTIICCVAQNFTQLLVGRCIKGVGGGGITALTAVVVTDIIPLRFRPTYYGLIQMAWAVGACLGPVAGGLIAEHTTWRMAFYINFPFCAIGLVLVPVAVRLRAERGSLKHRLLHVVDWTGGFFFIASVSSFLIGISWGGQMYLWSSWRTLVPVVVGVAGVIGSLLWERYGAKSPFIRLWLFEEKSAVAAYCCAILQGLLMFCKLYIVVLYLQACKGLTPTMSGVGVLGVNFGLIFISIVTGRLITKLGKYKWAIVSGWVIVIVSTAIMIAFDTSTPTYGWVLLFIPLGIGHGLVLISLNFSTQALAKERDGAHAAGMYIFSRTLGMCIGVAMGGTVLHNCLLRHLRNAGLPEGIAHMAESFIVTLNDQDRFLLRRDQIRDAYAEAFRNVFEVLTAISVLAAGLSLFIKQVSMDRALESEHVHETGIKAKKNNEA